jgi:hypothetical protein
VSVLGMDKVDLRSGARNALGFHPGALRITGGYWGPAAARRCAAGQGGGVAGGSNHLARPGASSHPRCPILAISSVRNLKFQTMTWSTLCSHEIKNIFDL